LVVVDEFLGSIVNVGDREVARRWYKICPARKTPEGLPAEPTEGELNLLLTDAPKFAEIRLRLECQES
jgi:hypothetical protein